MTKAAVCNSETWLNPDEAAVISLLPPPPHSPQPPAELLKKNKKTEEDMTELDEHKALSVLHRWGEMREFCVTACPLVPEHVEVRSLLNTDKPGLPQVMPPTPQLLPQESQSQTCVFVFTKFVYIQYIYNIVSELQNPEGWP